MFLGTSKKSIVWEGKAKIQEPVLPLTSKGALTCHLTSFSCRMLINKVGE